MIVVDASAIVDAVVEWPPGVDIRDRLDEEVELAAPHLIDLEVAQALRRLIRHGDLSFERAHVALDDFAELNLTRYPHELLVDRIWELRDSLSAYDAAYVTLAEALAVPMITCDAALAKAATGTDAEVELYA